MGVFDYYGSGRTHASLFQRGGKAYFGQRNQIGHFGYSYVEQLGGELNFIGETRIGTRTANGSHNIGSAVMAFYGGSATALNGDNYIGMSSGFGDKYYHVDDLYQYAGIYLKGGSLRSGPISRGNCKTLLG